MPLTLQSAPELSAWSDATASQALDVLATPLMLLALDGEVLSLNAAARRLVTEEPMLALRAGYLRPRRAADQAGLGQALRRMEQGCEAEGLCVFRARQGGCSLVLMLRRLGGAPPRLLLSARMPMAAVLPSLPLVAAVFGLTHGQARVAALCSMRMDVAAMAEATGLAGETVRNHLKAAMRVTGARSQAQLALMVTRGLGHA